MLARLALIVALVLSDPASGASDPPAGDLYALLVAGSNGWWNYRHQADVAHAYHVLRGHGVPENKIIVMMYDDIANHKRNPYKGKLFNKPNGTDLYEGLKIDYKGDSVTPQNFIAILKGDKKSVKGGNGRVIESTRKDRIFVYFSDHGSFGSIAFVDDLLTAKQLNKALNDMYTEHRYRQLVFYLEACESGSMFKKILKENIDVYAITAANSDESSFATYCGNGMKLPCMGDEFSVTWMEDSDQEDLAVETLNRQFQLVKKGTVSSHVMRYGDFDIGKEPVGWFQGEKRVKIQENNAIDKVQHDRVSWPSRDVELMHLQKQVQLNSESAERELRQLLEVRRKIEEVFTNLVNNLVKDPSDRRRIFEEKDAVENLDCYDEVVHLFDLICIDVNKYDYALKYINALSNLCTRFNDSAYIIKAMWTTCSSTRSQFF